MKWINILLACSLLASSLAAEVEVAAKEKKSKLKFCPALKCGDKPTEIERWKCVNNYLYKPVKEGKNPAKEYYIEHDCGGVGWGNSIRGLYNAAALAAMLGRRLIVTHGPFNRMFDPPHVNMTSWTFGLAEKGISTYSLRQHWDFEKHGRSPNRYANFAQQIKANPKSVKDDYEKNILVAGVCGGEREIMTAGDCLEHAMPDFIKCASSRDHPGGYIHDNMLPVPFFTGLFTRPSALMAESLAKVRDKVGLPQLTPGQEPYPGAWGLRTPGYYILALHFRNIPVGFEPLSIDLNKKSTRKNRDDILAGYWDTAERYARKAKKLAACRGEELFIYFATDDIIALRPEAEKRLSKFAKVNFGLQDHEVGHMSPQWSATDEKILERARKDRTVQHLKSYSEPGNSEVMLDREGNPVEAEEEFYVAEVAKDRDSVEVHANMAMVEWWILAQSNWLMGHSGTSFSDSAAGVGLSPLGVMERMDLVHGMNHASTSMRRDWESDSCSQVGAANPAHRETCPNKKGENEGHED